jgi:phage terminase large subunit-like protein
MPISLNWTSPGPVSSAFAESQGFARALMGPMKGGRRWTAVADIILKPQQLARQGLFQPRWRWLACAPDMAKLSKTIDAWKARVPTDIGSWDEKALTHWVRYGIGQREGRIVAVELEIHFLSLDRPEHRKKLLQLPTTGIWLDWAKHYPEDILADAIDAAGTYPDSLHEDALWSGVILTSRMPAEDHFLAKRQDIERYRQPGGRTHLAEGGHYLPKNFYQRQASRGKGDEWVRVNVDAEYGGSTIDANAARAAAAEGKSLDEYLAERRALYDAFPEEGPLRRELYPKHLEFFKAGAKHHERAFIAGNRVGKTYAGCYEAALHLTGWYPLWWEGRRFERPTTWWAAGEDAKAVREGMQLTLMGPPEKPGTGLIPFDKIGRSPTRGGIPDALDFAEIRYRDSGYSSHLVYKAYEQKRKSFQSAKIDGALLDEEPPFDIYTETLTRTMSTNPAEPSGLIMGLFTPLQGISATVLNFLPGGAYPETEELRKTAWGW